ncbi:histone H3 [Pancytospora epiphaga]|nr:histone H3 [Pancytospora epiphaga]
MARTAHTARKAVAPGGKTVSSGGKTISSSGKTMGEKKPTKSLSVRTPTISQQEKPKKAKRPTQNTVLKEIKYYQNNIGFLIPRASLVRLVREISRVTLKSIASEGLRFTSSSLNILQESLENHLVCLMELAYMASRHAKRITLFPSDIRLINRIKSCGY